MASSSVRERVTASKQCPLRLNPTPISSSTSISSWNSMLNGNGNNIRNTQSDSSQVTANRLSEHPWLIIALVFITYVLLLVGVYCFFPRMTPSERKNVKIPWNMQEAKALGTVLDHYKDAHYWKVLFGLALVYIFLQTFAIPGSIFLSILSGFLFSFYTAITLVCFCSATGASFCYVLSLLVGRQLITGRYLEKIQEWADKVDEERDNLLNYIIFLRITPLLPNWFINIASPHIGIPLKTFWFGTFIGVAPPSVLAVQAGSTLNVMTSPTDHISWGSIIVLGLIAVGSLMPVLLRGRSP